MGSEPVLNVQPKSSLSDEKLDIHVTGLAPGQEVTILAQVQTECGRHRFLSQAIYKANDHGRISVREDPSLGGSYTGIEPMGLLWSLTPAPEVKDKYRRLVKFDVTKPFEYTFQLVDHQQGQANETNILASTTIERRYVADYVEQIPVKLDRVQGILFLPEKREHSDPLPVILDIRGLVGRLVVDRAAVLASHGFAVFCYDYFTPIRLASTEEDVYLDSRGFQDIFDFIADHSRLDVTRVGITCSCYGGVVSLNAVSRLKLPVKCMAAAGFPDIIGVNVGWIEPDGTVIEPVGPIGDYMKTWKADDGKLWLGFVEVEDSKLTNRVAPVENIECPMLMFGHGDDRHMSSLKRTLIVKEKLEKAGKGHLIDYHLLPGTGHFLDVPYLPNCPISNTIISSQIGRGRIQPHYAEWGGGDAKMSARDQEFAWRKIINFFRTHLGVTKMYRQDWISEYIPPSQGH